MGDSFTAVPSAIAQLGQQFTDAGSQVAQAASDFGGGAFEVADAFGLLGACDGAMEKYVSMTRSTMQGLKQLAELWNQTGVQLGHQAEAYEACEEEQHQRFQDVERPLDAGAEAGDR